jgi:ABC-2 type transport system ATP-binding protein
MLVDKDPGSGAGRSAGGGQAPVVLRLSGVRKSFRRHLSMRPVKVIHGLSLNVVGGTIHGLLGPNGAGKTTTIRVALGLLRADEGTIEIFGRPASDPEARRSLGFLPENPYFYDYLTAREFLDLSARLIGLPRESRAGEIRRLLDLVGMAGRAEIPMRRCSKGMVQRVGMAQALMGDPDLVVLDEPMSGLDPVGRREFRDLILEHRRRGKTVFLSSHILQDAEMICDRVSILDQGQLVAEGDLRSLLGRDIKFWEVTLFGCAPSSLEPLAGAWEPVTTAGPEMLVRVRSEQDLDRLVRIACNGGGRVRSIVPCRETLEDLFLRQVGRSTRTTPSRDDPDRTPADRESEPVG